MSASVEGNSRTEASATSTDNGDDHDEDIYGGFDEVGCQNDDSDLAPNGYAGEIAQRPIISPLNPILKVEESENEWENESENASIPEDQSDDENAWEDVLSDSNLGGDAAAGDKVFDYVDMMGYSAPVNGSPATVRPIASLVGIVESRVENRIGKHSGLSERATNAASRLSERQEEAQERLDVAKKIAIPPYCTVTLQACPSNLLPTKLPVPSRTASIPSKRGASEADASPRPPLRRQRLEPAADQVGDKQSFVVDQLSGRTEGLLSPTSNTIELSSDDELPNPSGTGEVGVRTLRSLEMGNMLDDLAVGLPMQLLNDESTQVTWVNYGDPKRFSLSHLRPGVSKVVTAFNQNVHWIAATTDKKQNECEIMDSYFDHDHVNAIAMKDTLCQALNNMVEMGGGPTVLRAGWAYFHC